MTGPTELVGLISAITWLVLVSVGFGTITGVTWLVDYKRNRCLSAEPVVFWVAGIWFTRVFDDPHRLQNDRLAVISVLVCAVALGLAGSVQAIRVGRTISHSALAIIHAMSVSSTLVAGSMVVRNALFVLFHVDPFLSPVAAYDANVWACGSLGLAAVSTVLGAARDAVGLVPDIVTEPLE